MTTLAEDLPKEIARVRVILGHYEELGHPGMFGAAFIRNDIEEAIEAIISGDVVKMITSFKTLQEIKD